MHKNLFIVLVVFLFAMNVSGQTVDETKQKVKDKTKDHVNQKIDEGIEKSFDKIEKGLSDLFDGDGENGDENNDETENDDANSLETNIVKDDLKTYSKFDFIPGEEVIFFDNFSDVELGEFPLKWNTTGSGEIITINKVEGKWFKMMGDYSYFAPEVGVVYPDNFTIEFDAIFPETVELWFDFYDTNSEYLANGYYPGNGGFYISFMPSAITEGIYDNNIEDGNRELGEGTFTEIKSGELVHFSFWGQKQRIRVYVNEEKALDLPRGINRKYPINIMRIGCIQELFITNFRFAVGAPDTRSRLITEGILVTRGITFDSGSDVIKSESYGVLKDISTVLNENKDVRVKIVGHTDSDGDDNSNMSLSKKRAQAVKSALESQFGIDGSRMEADGLGESQPVSSNDTAEGKANNRRVEFIKL
ncbi:MAG: OmpA family protein [Bacteroidetes bacterium]|nr:OmpA family protein [Bacteroidota bacterium]